MTHAKFHYSANNKYMCLLRFVCLKNLKIDIIAISSIIKVYLTLKEHIESKHTETFCTCKLCFLKTSFFSDLLNLLLFASSACVAAVQFFMYYTIV